MKVSIVIPYHPRENSEEHLRRVLAALGDQGKFSVPGMHLPVIRPELKTYRKTHHEAEAIVVTDKVSPPEGRKNICHKINVGLKMTHGDVFVLDQQDVIASPGSIELMTEHVLRHPDHVVFAQVLRQNIPGDQRPSIGVGPALRNRLWWLIAANRQKLIDLGGIDEDFQYHWGWDDTISVEWWERHLNVVYVDWATGLHLYHPQDPGSNKEAFYTNQDLYFKKMTNPNYFPNKGREWGVVYDGQD